MQVRDKLLNCLYFTSGKEYLLFERTKLTSGTFTGNVPLYFLVNKHEYCLWQIEKFDSSPDGLSVELEIVNEKQQTKKEFVDDLGDGLPPEKTLQILMVASLGSANKMYGNLMSHSMNFQWTVPNIEAEDELEQNTFNTIIPGDRNF
jgi:hypothetical protein